jgi:copper transport protein
MVTALLLLLTVAAGGHAVADPEPTIALVVDLAHLSAMSLWFGGLAMLSCCGLSARGGSGLGPGSGPDLERFSRIAFWSVVVLVITGLYPMVRQVGTPAALWATGYGRLLLAKLAGVAILVVLGYLSRRFTGRWRAATAAGSRPLRRTVAGESAFGVGILAVVAVLVAQTPARISYVPTARAEVDLGVSGTATLRLSPDRPGANQLRVDLADRGGHPFDPKEITVTATQRDARIGPLRMPLERAATGQYRSATVTLPSTGRWTLTVRLRSSEFDARVASVDVQVG